MTGKGGQYRKVDRDKYSDGYDRVFNEKLLCSNTKGITTGKIENFLCACDGRACTGTCREKNLNRKRNWDAVPRVNKQGTTPLETDTCPAAHKRKDKE